MKTLATLALAALATASFAAPAAAFAFHPPNHVFVGTGLATITRNGATVECKMTIKGKTLAHPTHAATINGVAFSPGAAACANIAATGLSWPTFATGTNAATIHNVGLIFGGACGPPSTVPVAVAPSGATWTITSAPVGACTLSVTLTMTPPIRAF